MAIATHQISLATTTGLITGVNIDGPTAGMTNRDYAFTALADPANYSQLVYTWDPEPASGQGTYIGTYQWPDAGPKIITLTVDDGVNTFVVTHPINLSVLTGLDIVGATAGVTR